jgi:hypothetical protein
MAEVTTNQATATAKKAKKGYQIKKGSADEKLIKFLKRHHGTLTVEEMAPQVERRGGEFGIEPDSLRSQISKVKNAMIRAGLPEDKVLAIMPKDFGEGRGRRSSEVASPDDLLSLLESDDDDNG